ncbi:MAG: NERD domain-containing protein [Desulfovibrionales bacterium]|nr:MAG: NERD domain-containing protein [Desulfovibrionales bacterium]
MSTLYHQVLPISILFVSFAVIVCFSFAHRKITELKRRRSPFTKDFLRGPGFSESKRIEQISEELDVWLLVLVVMPITMYSILYIFIHQPDQTFQDNLILFIPFALFFGFGLYKMNFYLNQRRNARLGFEGEMAVGQELNQLLANGYYVFHDYPASKYNIDHVLVGPAGVFAVETKARSKPTSGDGRTDARVEYNGKQLIFPGWTEIKPIQQAKRQAAELSAELSKAVGDQVRVHPVLAIPGWYVERTAKPDMYIINGKGAHSVFCKLPVVLDTCMIQRIAYQVEQKCRDVKPMAYREWED